MRLNGWVPDRRGWRRLSGMTVKLFDSPNESNFLTTQ